MLSSLPPRSFAKRCPRQRLTIFFELVNFLDLESERTRAARGDPPGEKAHNLTLWQRPWGSIEVF